VGGNDGAAFQLHIGKEALIAADEKTGIKRAGKEHTRIFSTEGNRVAINKPEKSCLTQTRRGHPLPQSL
jgi:hypothetical protein